MLQKDYVTMHDSVLLLDLATRTSKISFPAFSLNTTLGLSLSLMKCVTGSAEHLSTRQLILQHRLRSQLVFVYIYIYIRSGMQLPVKLKACMMVHPGSSVLPESDSPCSSRVGRSVVRSVNVCWYDTMELSLLDRSAV